jgi:hypothetical protein
MAQRKLKDPVAQARLDREHHERATKALARRAAGWQNKQPLTERRLQLVPVSDTATRTRRGRPRRHRWVRTRAAA